MAAVQLHNVTFNYGPVRVLDDVSLDIMPGTLTALTGSNGAGKSTLLKIMAGLLKPKAGQVKVHHPLAYLPQLATLSRDFPLTVRQIVASGLWPQLGERQPVTRVLLDKADDKLAEVGLADFGHRQLADLSGGQFQRVLLARVMMQEAQLILLDEPFAAIDTDGQALLMHILQGWQQQGRTVVCVSHDPHLVQAHFPHIIACENGQVWQGLAREVPTPLKQRMFA